jgi:hypothetical protein
MVRLTVVNLAIPAVNLAIPAVNLAIPALTLPSLHWLTYMANQHLIYLLNMSNSCCLLP